MDIMKISAKARSQILELIDVYADGRNDMLDVLREFDKGNMTPSLTLELASKIVNIDIKNMKSMVEGLRETAAKVNLLQSKMKKDDGNWMR